MDEKTLEKKILDSLVEIGCNSSVNSTLSSNSSNPIATKNYCDFTDENPLGLAGIIKSLYSTITAMSPSSFTSSAYTSGCACDDIRYYCSNPIKQDSDFPCEYYSDGKCNYCCSCENKFIDKSID